jgi:hypothetical protein
MGENSTGMGDLPGSPRDEPTFYAILETCSHVNKPLAYRPSVDKQCSLHTRHNVRLLMLCVRPPKFSRIARLENFHKVQVSPKCKIIKHFEVLKDCTYVRAIQLLSLREVL